WMPRSEDLDLEGMANFTKEDYQQLMEVDREAWLREAVAVEELEFNLYGKLPKEFLLRRELLISRLWHSPGSWRLYPELPHCLPCPSRPASHAAGAAASVRRARTQGTDVEVHRRIVNSHRRPPARSFPCTIYRLSRLLTASISGMSAIVVASMAC